MPDAFAIWNKESCRFLGGLYESSADAMQVMFQHPTPNDLKVVVLSPAAALEGINVQS